MKKCADSSRDLETRLVICVFSSLSKANLSLKIKLIYCRDLNGKDLWVQLAVLGKESPSNFSMFLSRVSGKGNEKSQIVWSFLLKTGDR